MTKKSDARLLHDRLAERGFDVTHGDVRITTSRGVVMRCLPIAPLLEEIGAQATQIQPPTYIIEDVSGAQIERAHTVDTIKDAPEAEVLAWQTYLTAKAQAEFEANERQLKVIAVRGVEILSGLSETWDAEQEFLGIAVPTHPLERRYHCFKTEAIGTRHDGLLIGAGIYLASGMDEEVIAAIEATFPDTAP